MGNASSAADFASTAPIGLAAQAGPLLSMRFSRTVAFFLSQGSPRMSSSKSWHMNASGNNQINAWIATGIRIRPFDSRAVLQTWQHSLHELNSTRSSISQAWSNSCHANRRTK